MQVIVNGILFGALLALAAAGLALIFGVMRIVNLAHGEFIAAGAFFGFFAIGSWQLNVWVALLVVLAAGALTGFILQVVLLRKIVGEPPLRSLLMTFGLSMVLLGSLSLAFSGNVRSYEAPFAGSLSALGIQVPRQSVLIAGVAVALFMCLIAMLFWTKTGAALRATAQHRDAAAACGVNLAKIDAVALAVSLALVGAAGLLLSMRFPVRPEFGQPWLLQSIIVIVLGGMGSLFGAAAGGVTVGVAFTLLSYQYGSVVGQLALYAGIFLLLLVRPHGFAGQQA
jgi:branched-chain amino acid transport system permease protein